MNEAISTHKGQFTKYLYCLEIASFLAMTLWVTLTT